MSCCVCGWLLSPQSSCRVVCVVDRDLDQASMEAVAALLAGLPLQPEESDRGDLMEAKSQLFLKSVSELSGFLPSFPSVLSFFLQCFVFLFFCLNFLCSLNHMAS